MFVVLNFLKSYLPYLYSSFTCFLKLFDRFCRGFMNIKNILFSGTVVFITLEHATASTNELETKPEDKARSI